MELIDRIEKINKNIWFASYILTMFDLFDRDQIDYWTVYEVCFNENLVNDIKKENMDSDLAKALLLISEYDTCKSYLSDMVVNQSREQIRVLLENVIRRNLDADNSI